MALWVWTLEPALAAPLAVFRGLTGQTIQAFTVRRAFHFSALQPFVLGGLAGIPQSLWLPQLDMQLSKLVLGAMLVVVCPVRMLRSTCHALSVPQSFCHPLKRLVIPRSHALPTLPAFETTVTEGKMTQQAHFWRVSGAMVAGAATLALYGCGSGSPDAASNASNIQASWVVLGSGNQATARAITSYSAPAGGNVDAVCPMIVINGQATRMGLRVGSATVPLRPTASDPSDSKPSDFPVSVCETALPANTTDVKIAGQSLPLPVAEPQRIVVLGDTGCRMKKADNAWQACGDTQAWPFATVANTAADFKPDLVLHVGDYHYRENACPADIKGCQGSPWGYGWDTWQADLFKPAAKLLAAAPWIMVRGNHEECARAGQGWFRFLDTQPFSATRSCDNAANDGVANYSDPYAVRLGSNTQVVVFDSAKTGKVALKPTDAQFAIYQKQFQQVAALSAKAGLANTIFTNHHPILAFAPVPGSAPAPGNLALQSAMSSLYLQAYYPPGVNLALHGHVHNFQAISFKTGQPATIVSGDAGDNLDVALPDPLSASATPAPGAVIDHITHHASFGFLVMDRRAAPSTGWTFKAYSAVGKLMATCQQEGYKLDCDKTGFLTP